MTQTLPARSGRNRAVWLRVLMVLLAGAFLFLSAPKAAAETNSWNGVVDEMAAVLQGADTAYRAGDPQGAKDAVNQAYYGYYEKLGFEATTMSYISGARGAEIEYQFAQLLKDINAGVPADQLDADLTTLSDMLREDANVLDGHEESPYAVFVQAFLIMLREGFEAIIVVGAIIAYLVKSGNGDKTKIVYAGAGLALLASLALAWLFSTLTGLAGANQEIVEGVTILIAVAMLIYVSNWILSRSETQAFERYIKRKSDESLASGSMFTLAFVAFLAVFREGAEVILFYQALLVRSPEESNQLWLGMAAGVVALVGVYLAIRLLSIKIPLKPFFLATSALLALMAFSFTGSGIKELQEAGVIGVTPLPGVPTIDLLGIYPTVETLTAQAVVAVTLIVLAVLGIRKGRAVSGAPAVEPGQASTPEPAPHNQENNA